MPKFTASKSAAFSLCVIALLFVELFSPLTFAQETPSGPTTNPVSPSSGIQQGSGDCYSNSLTPSQTKAFWDATFGFIGQEINALAYNQLLQNKAGAIAQQPQNLTVVIDPDSSKLYAVKDVAGVMGRDPAQVAEDLNADVNGTVDMATVKAYMAAKPGPAGALERLLGIRPKLQVEKPAFDNYKIALPNNRTLSLREIFAMEEIGQGTDKCLLDHSDIKGKVSYISLLGKDLFIGFDQSSTTVNANQHVTSTNTFSALNLNGGSTIVIPKRYLDYASFVKKVLEIDTMLAITETALAMSNKLAVERLRTSQKETAEIFKDLKPEGLNPKTAKGFDEVYQDLADQTVDLMSPETIGKYCAGTRAIALCQQEVGKTFTILVGRAYNNFAMGMMWLGPGRLALGASNAISFGSNDRKLADNYLQVFADTPVAGEFRSASNWMLSGAVIDIISDFMHNGVPRAVFQIGPIYLVNMPDKAASSEEGKASLTSLSSDVDRWNIATYWKGRSTATNFEDIKSKNDYARLSLYSNNMTLGANLEHKKEFSSYYELLLYSAPLLSWKFLKFPSVEEGALFTTLARVAITDMYISNLVDPATMKKDEMCDDAIVRNWEIGYTAATAASQISSLAITPGVRDFFKRGGGKVLENMAKEGAEDIAEESAETAAKGLTVGQLTKKAPGPFKSLAKKLWDASQFISPFELAKMYAASGGFQYVSNCKDTSYTILGYQPLEQKPKGGVSALKEKLNPIGVDKLVGNLSIGSALQGVGQNIDKESQTEIINLRTLMQDQQGMVTPTKLYYLHLDGATQEWWGVFEQLENKGCFRKCIDGNYTAICMTENGVELINKVTGERTKLADKDHALMSQLDPATGSAMIPNTLVSAKMNCAPQQTILQVKSDSHLYAGSGCSSIDCLISELSRLTGTAVGSDLSQPLGKVKALHTDRGLVTVENGVIRFVRTAGTESELKGIGAGIGRNETEVMAEDERTGTVTRTRSLVGTETRIPSLDAERGVDGGSVQGNIYSPSSIDIRGDGSVVASGYTTDSQGSSEMGQFISMTLEKGKIEYDRQGQRILVALYVLGEVNAPESIKSINVAATKNVDENGKETPAIRIDNVQPKPGQEEFADSFNKGLQQVQGAGGMQMLDTADKTYYFTTDAAGNPVLRVLDKKTGKYSDYKITGQITSDGKTVSVPTDKGPFAFNFSMNDKGQPTLTVNGPDGYKDIATLLAARGQNGIIIFDPATGSFRAFNGQDMSLNRDFATKGLTYVGSPEGVRGVPTDNFLDYRRQGTGDSAGGPNLLALPSFPENALLAGAMLLAIVVGVVAIRVHSMPTARARSRKKRG